ncbi:hypothetical protein J6590_034258 [Homalodisca vitripennis]|nr:hypothetical protein J6590_034258 [Homalodisca vitripennis]
MVNSGWRIAKCESETSGLAWIRETPVRSYENNTIPRTIAAFGFSSVFESGLCIRWINYKYFLVLEMTITKCSYKQYQQMTMPLAQDRPSTSTPQIAEDPPRSLNQPMRRSHIRLLIGIRFHRQELGNESTVKHKQSAYDKHDAAEQVIAE